jgi:hypothetical protein
MRWVLKGCPVCGGDLHENLHDNGWLTCFMCAREFPFSDGQIARPGNGLAKRGALRRQDIVKQIPYRPSHAEVARRAA